jgi:hypothetical protein
MSVELKTLEDVVNYSSYYDIRNFADVKEINGYSFIEETALNKYLPLILPYVQKVATLDVHKKYNHRPKLLSKILYGTPDLDWIILYFNGKTASRFIVHNTINVIQKDDLEKVFDILVTRMSV